MDVVILGHKFIPVITDNSEDALCAILADSTMQFVSLSRYCYTNGRSRHAGGKHGTIQHGG